MEFLRSWVVGGLVTAFAGVTVVACAGPVEEGEAAGSEDALTAKFRPVDIIVSGTRTGESYEARSYPTDDADNDGKIELYHAPVFFVFVDGTDAAGNKVRREWKSPRYMPYFNDPANPHKEYKTRGFVSAGLSKVARQLVPQYKPDYEIHNRFSPFGGAIVVKGTFYIHAGPSELAENGWGSAGCVEIIGNFDNFKKDVLELAGSTQTDLNKGISELVAAKKLFVTYEFADRPNLKAALSREVSAEPERVTRNDSTTDVSNPE